ncbi:VOC family protein [Actinokineospora sp. HUAS TT18]|uniref:VOC family protein n=1 Tax=Actinokineospora sp. HUAS TT18 TaxID=3447451 RepID=UPI003F5203B9
MHITHAEASAAVSDLGWRDVLGTLTATVAVDSLSAAAEVAATVAALSDHLHLDLRPDRVVLRLQTPASRSVTRADVEAAQRISAAVATEAHPGAQLLEYAVDALDIDAVRPFWRAILAYEDEPNGGGLRDPLGVSPAVWFQQMDIPRPQRNRVHLDISVAHDEAERRVAAAIEAGGVLVSDAAAPSFWVLADVEGNEACVTTWQGRD